MRVTNLNGSTSISCGGGSWLAYWEKTSGQKAFMCFVKDCINTPSSGGLVQKDGRLDRSWYVVPLCKECGKKTRADLEIWDQATLVCAYDATAPHAVSGPPIEVAQRPLAVFQRPRVALQRPRVVFQRPSAVSSRAAGSPS
jgi:hypothetical protein